MKPQALEARMSPGVSDGVSPKIGVSNGVAFRALRLEYPKSVPSVQDTLGTLLWTLRTGARGPKGAGDNPLGVFNLFFWHSVGQLIWMGPIATVPISPN